MNTLKGWQSTRNQRNLARAQRLGLAVVIACLLIAFTWLLRAPFHRGDLQVILLSPNVSSLNSAGNVQSVDSSDSDLAGLLCQVSGAAIADAIGQSLPYSLLELDGRSLQQQVHSLEFCVSKNLKKQSTVLVYLNGVLSLENGQPALCSSGHGATHGGGEIDILPLVELLQHASCHQVLLCIDIVPPNHTGPAIIAAPLIGEQLAESIERSLSQHAGRTPLAVCICMPTCGQTLAAGQFTTALAAAICESIEQEVAASHFNLHRFKDFLAHTMTASTSADRSAQPIWLTSIHWPITSTAIPFTEPIVAEPKTITEPVDSREPAMERPSHSRRDDESQLAASAQRIRWLQLPARLSRAQQHPFTTALQTYRMRELAAAGQLRPAASSEKAFRIASQSDQTIDATNSLLLNVALGQTGRLSEAECQQSLELLRQLILAMDQAADSKQLLDTIQKLSTSSSIRYLELGRCQEICSSLADALDWNTLQRLLRLELLALRSHADLFQDDPSSQRWLRQADIGLNEIRTSILSAAASLEDLELVSQIDRTIGLYGAAIDCMTRATDNSLRQHEAIVQSLCNHEWTQVQSLSSQSACQALERFEQAWQQTLESAQAPPSMVLKEQFDSTRRVLADAGMPTGKQIESVLQLDHVVTAALESYLVATANSPSLSGRPTGLQPLNSADRCKPAALQLLANLLSSGDGPIIDDWLSDRQVQSLRCSQPPTRLVNFSLSPISKITTERSRPREFTVELLAESGQPSAEQGAGDAGMCTLQANCQQSVALWLAGNFRGSTSNALPGDGRKLHVRVWGVRTPVPDVPSSMLNGALAEQWVHSQPSLRLLSEAKSVELDGRKRQRVTLVPVTVAPPESDAKQPDSEPPKTDGLTGFVVTIADEHSEFVQIDYQPLRILLPHEYIREEVKFDASRQVVDIAATLLNVGNVPSAQVSYRLVEWPSQKLVAEATAQPNSASTQSHVVLSASRNRADRMAVITEVDGCPSSFVTAIDPVRGIISTAMEAPSTVMVHSNYPDAVVPRSADKVEAILTTVADNLQSDRPLEVKFGWDRNRDRTLQGESSSRIVNLRSTKTRFLKVEETGTLIMNTSVEPLRLTLPTSGLRNERAQLVVELIEDERTIASTSTVLVIDQQPPVITNLQVAGGHGCLAGAPLVAQVSVTDQGLSGIAQVEGAWSMNGQMQLSDSMKPVPAVLRPDGSWTLTLPTVGLPEGDNLVLVRANDKAGNVSESYSSLVRLITQRELDDLSARQTSTLSGSLMYVKLPQANLTVELLKMPEESPEKKTDDKKEPKVAEETVIASATSAADGGFRMHEVPGGVYVLRVKGIVRGMRVEQSRPVTIEPHKRPTPIHWRLDKPL